MKIHNLRQVSSPPSVRGFQCIARFNLDLSDDIRIFDFQLIKAPDGKVTAYVPNGPSGSPVGAIAPTVRAEIARLAYREFHSDSTARAA